MENLGALCERLTAEGMDPETPAAAMRWGTTPAQRVVTAPVKSLAAAARAAGFEQVMVVIGQAAALREKLNWFEQRLALFGRRVVVTRARAQASEFAALLEEQGAEVIKMPTFRIEPVPQSGTAALRGGRSHRVLQSGIRLDRVHERERGGRFLRRAGGGRAGRAEPGAKPDRGDRAGDGGKAEAFRHPRGLAAGEVHDGEGGGGAWRGGQVERAASTCPRSDIAPPRS